MKACIACCESKSLEDFYDQPGNRDGRAGKCKSCHKAAMIKRSRENPAVQSYDRMRAKRPEVRARLTANTRLWRRQNPEKYKAHTALNNALRDGRVNRSDACACGSSFGLHAHHHDYSKPLDVEWKCARCHHVDHAAERAA